MRNGGSRASVPCARRGADGAGLRARAAAGARYAVARATSGQPQKFEHSHLHAAAKRVNARVQFICCMADTSPCARDSTLFGSKGLRLRGEWCGKLIVAVMRRRRSASQACTSADDGEGDGLRRRPRRCRCRRDRAVACCSSSAAADRAPRRCAAGAPPVPSRPTYAGAPRGAERAQIRDVGAEVMAHHDGRVTASEIDRVERARAGSASTTCAPGNRCGPHRPDDDPPRIRASPTRGPPPRRARASGPAPHKSKMRRRREELHEGAHPLRGAASITTSRDDSLGASGLAAAVSSAGIAAAPSSRAVGAERQIARFVHGDQASRLAGCGDPPGRRERLGVARRRHSPAR